MLYSIYSTMTFKVMVLITLLPSGRAQTSNYSTADCKDLAKCMTHLGDHMNDAIVDLTHYTKDSMTRFYDTICGDVDDLVKCYEPKTFEGCSSLQPFIQFVPSQVELRKQFENMCAEREADALLVNKFQYIGRNTQAEESFVTDDTLDDEALTQHDVTLISAVECFVQDSVGIPLQRCTMTMISHIHLATMDGESQTMHSCLALSAYRACVIGVIDGKCDKKTLQYIKSSKAEQYYMVCASSKLIVNVCFIIILYFILVILQ